MLCTGWIRADNAGKCFSLLYRFRLPFFRSPSGMNRLLPNVLKGETVVVFPVRVWEDENPRTLFDEHLLRVFPAYSVFARMLEGRSIPTISISGLASVPFFFLSSNPVLFRVTRNRLPSVYCFALERPLELLHAFDRVCFSMSRIGPLVFSGMSRLRRCKSHLAPAGPTVGVSACTMSRNPNT